MGNLALYSLYRRVVGQFCPNSIVLLYSSAPLRAGLNSHRVQGTAGYIFSPGCFAPALTCTLIRLHTEWSGDVFRRPVIKADKCSVRNVPVARKR